MILFSLDTLSFMRTIEEIKKDQDEAIFKLGAHTALAEQFKTKVIQLADEANNLPPVKPVKPEEPKSQPDM